MNGKQMSKQNGFSSGPLVEVVIFDSFWVLVGDNWDLDCIAVGRCLDGGDCVFGNRVYYDFGGGYTLFGAGYRSG